ncbi:MAG TPA: DNA polymerase III subunit delta', partial [Burkholderiales bacterium]|nr:DNA polymerase III subunit delta' [Burkholderiales bacterium]
MLISCFTWQAEVWGQLLSRRRTLPHALLFRGKQGTGKAGFARALAQALLCEAPRGLVACGACASCVWFCQGTHPDFRSVEPEAIAGEKLEAEEGGERKPGERRARQQITVDQVRELADFVNVTSHRQGFKVVLVHPAESLNIHAANALLKTLEEPPPGTLFLLVSHRPRRVLPTILSRCEQVAMPLPTPEQAEHWLREHGVAQPAVPLAEAGFAPVAALEIAEPQRQAMRVGLLESLT